jgi:hypothetical protein
LFARFKITNVSIVDLNGNLMNYSFVVIKKVFIKHPFSPAKAIG